MKSHLFLVVALAIFTSSRLAAQHNHSTESGSAQVSHHIILQQLLTDKSLENRDVRMLIVDFPAKSTSAAHRHPCPTFGYVLEGEIESVFEGKTHVYRKGDSFYEQTNGLHSSARNTHPTAPAKLLVFFIAEKDKPASIVEK